MYSRFFFFIDSWMFITILYRCNKYYPMISDTTTEIMLIGISFILQQRDNDV